MDEALIRKLKMPQEGRVAILLPPAGFLEAVGLPDRGFEPDPAAPGSYDYVQLFADSVATLERHAPAALAAVKPGGMLWICYPKGTSGLKSDLNRDRGWEALAAANWEGVSLISVDDTWSAMRFRPAGAGGVRPRPAPAERRRASGSAAEAELAAPDDLLQALRAAPEAEAFFAKLAPSHKREYIQWIVEAKKAETRAGRIAKAAQKLQRGLKRPSDK